MRIVINHLTRMQKGCICVAGVDMDSGKHVRPLLQAQLRKRLLARYGGPFDIGRVVEFGWTKYIGTRPETEDYRFHQGEAQVLEDMPGEAFWQLLSDQARRKLGEIFGPELQPCGPASYAVDAGRGFASLGCYRPPQPVQLVLRRRPGRDRPQIRLQFAFHHHRFDLGVTDIRLYGADHVTPDGPRVAEIAARMERGEPAILGVGLTRPFRGQPDEPARHWLQVTNIHLRTDPCWQLG